MLPKTGNSLSRKYFNGMVPQQDTICPVYADKSTEEIHKLAACVACFFNAHCDHILFSVEGIYTGIGSLLEMSLKSFSFSLRARKRLQLPPVVHVIAPGHYYKNNKSSAKHTEKVKKDFQFNTNWHC